MTYTYDPTKIEEYGKDRMRFEIGDTLVDGGADTCALCDEEYEAKIGENSSKSAWNNIKLSVLEAVLFKMSYQVDTKIDVLQYDFSGRAEQWQKLYDDLKNDIKNTKSIPLMDAAAMNKPSYFYTDMNSNCRTIFGR